MKFLVCKMNKMSKSGEKALDLNASSSMPDLAHQNKINLPTPCHFHLKCYFLLVKPLIPKQLLLISHWIVYWKDCTTKQESSLV